MGHYFKQERETLEAIRSIEDPHLITPIAAYQFYNEENGNFLFPWAEGGNMREFWSTEKERPHKDPKMMTWILKQMCGLCHALSILHKKEYRHGDLKPENILLFHEGGYKGTLRIADVGLARFHEAPTQKRRDLMQVTDTHTGTMRYVSPEFFHAEQIPRVFDVWSLGCIFLEFLIWILYTNDQLIEFNKTSRIDHFWENVNGEFVVHSSVLSILNRLAEDLKGPDLKGPETALADILHVVRSRMLVPNAQNRSSSLNVHEELSAIYARAGREPAYLINPTIWSRTSTRPVPFRRSMGSSLGVPAASSRPRQPLQRPQISSSTHDSNETPAIMIQEADDGNANTATTLPTTIRIAREVGFCFLSSSTHQARANCHSTSM